MYAIIGGSGLAALPELTLTTRRIIRTPYGTPSCPLVFGTLGRQDIVFLARHGLGHTLAPHEINYRANIWALKECAVAGIVSVAAVASMNARFTPGQVVLPEDLLDFTYSRRHTFFEGVETPVVHTQMHPIYDAQLREWVHEAARQAGAPLTSGGIYTCIQGPRLPTAAEVRRYQNDGGDLLGMTGMPEAALAREMNIPYLHICGITAWAAGCGDSATGTLNAAAQTQTSQAIEEIRRMLKHLFI